MTKRRNEKAPAAGSPKSAGPAVRHKQADPPNPAHTDSPRSMSCALNRAEQYGCGNKGLGVGLFGLGAQYAIIVDTHIESKLTSQLTIRLIIA